LLEHPIQESFFSFPAEQPGPELGQDAVVEAWVGELQAEGILPVDAASHGVGGLPIGEVLHELENGNESQPPRRERRWPPMRVEVLEVLVFVDRPQLISKRQVAVPLGKSSRSGPNRRFGDIRVIKGRKRHQRSGRK
jgi:hypothetical protein